MFTFTGRDGLRIHVHEWRPEGPARGVVQIAHGMGEHAGRYDPLARALNARGYTVYANDHRGHGATMHAGPGVLGKDGWNLLVEDVAELSRVVGGRHPELPLVLVGHSLGSFAAQQYLLKHPGLADGVALCGTTAVDLLLADLAQAGPDVMASLNAPFQPARTDFDWLSRDPAQVDAYIADPLCGFSLDDEGMGGLAAAATRLADPSGAPVDLPLYLFVGDRDPLNKGLAHSDRLVERYRRAGVAHLLYRTYEGAHHELFNETHRDEVVADLADWIDRVAAGEFDRIGAEWAPGGRGPAPGPSGG
ncbi:alpha/beta hydrolase [Nocardiopsis sp. N85]|uniref:alpha/beta fold hydrolase n=1 Tax=Nocardiopsis sp. N85 TaxID=3029400 RepID=UPI00237F4221|nr:alpha/beta hydrolase [Nocardiopsis sp. N85]MDE3724157.1 alpha/beta hydrolase [Nocardiopsis sp. N85]